MNHFTASALLTSFFSFLVFLCSLAHKESNKKISRIFALYWLSITFWSLFVGLQNLLIQKIGEALWGWFLHLGVLFIPTLFFHFSLIVTHRITKNRLGLTIAYGLTTLFLLLNSFTNTFTHGTAYRDAYAYPIPALVYPVYFISFVFFVCWGTILLLGALSRVPDEKRGVAHFFLLFHVLGYLGGMDNFAIMWDARIFPLYPFGLYLVPFYACAAILLLKKEVFPISTRGQDNQHLLVPA